MGLVSGSGVNVDPARLLARGGQGEVFEVASQPNVVFKRYLASELEKDPTLPDRLAVMLANRPSKWREASSHHILVTWPTDTVAEDGRFVGCLMPRIDSGRTARLLRVADPTDRDGATGATEWLRGFTWRYLLATAANLAFGVEVLHGADVVIGDFNDANVAVTPAARVTLFDCDSMQITDPLSGRHFLCRVGRPDFTPPELVGADLRTTVRPRSSDLFALTVHIHLLLLQGEHPFRGHWNGLGDPPVETVLARRGLWTYGGQEKIGPRPAAIGIDLLPPDIIALFRRALVKGATTPGLRPSATEWKEALTHLASNLATCHTRPDHTYPNFHTECPWCQHEARLATLIAPRAPAPRSSLLPSAGRSRRPAGPPGSRPTGPTLRPAALVPRPAAPAPGPNTLARRPAAPTPRPAAPAPNAAAPAAAPAPNAAAPAPNAAAPGPNPSTLRPVPYHFTGSSSPTSGLAPSPSTLLPPPTWWHPVRVPLAPSTTTPTSRPWWSGRSSRRQQRGRTPSRTWELIRVLFALLALGFELFIRIAGWGSSDPSGPSTDQYNPFSSLSTEALPLQIFDPQGARLAASTPYHPTYSFDYHPAASSGTGFAPAPGDIGKTEMSSDALLITLDARVENVRPNAGLPAPPSGMRYEAFIFTVKNTGSGPESQEVNSEVAARPVGATTRVRAGKNGDTQPLPVQCAGQNAFLVYPSQSVQVCATFEVPANEEFGAVYWSWNEEADPGEIWYLSSP